MLTVKISSSLTEIDIVSYPNSRLAAIHGLTDRSPIVVEASRISHDLGDVVANTLPVTHCQIASDGNGSVRDAGDRNGIF